jgi:hypothetical protein
MRWDARSDESPCKEGSIHGKDLLQAKYVVNVGEILRSLKANAQITALDDGY